MSDLDVEHQNREADVDHVYTNLHGTTFITTPEPDGTFTVAWKLRSPFMDTFEIKTFATAEEADAFCHSADEHPNPDAAWDDPDDGECPPAA